MEGFSVLKMDTKAVLIVSISLNVTALVYSLIPKFYHAIRKCIHLYKEGCVERQDTTNRRLNPLLRSHGQRPTHEERIEETEKVISKGICNIVLVLLLLIPVIQSSTITLTDPFFAFNTSVRNANCLLLTFCIFNGFLGFLCRKSHSFKPMTTIVHYVIPSVVLLTTLSTRQSAILVTAGGVMTIDVITFEILAMMRQRENYLQEKSYVAILTVNLIVTFTCQFLLPMLITAVSCLTTQSRFLRMDSVSVTTFFFAVTFFISYTIWIMKTLFYSFLTERKKIAEVTSLCRLEGTLETWSEGHRSILRTAQTRTLERVNELQRNKKMNMYIFDDPSSPDHVFLPGIDRRKSDSPKTPFASRSNKGLKDNSDGSSRMLDGPHRETSASIHQTRIGTTRSVSQGRGLELSMSGPFSSTDALLVVTEDDN